MHLKRTAMFACGGAALAAWLAAATTSGVRAPAPPAPRTIAVERQDADLATQIARLHERLTPAAAPVRPGRDLFRFADRAKKVSATTEQHRPALVEAAAPAPMPALPARPAVKLDGIASDVRDGAEVRTAILTTQGQLFLAREGDNVTARYKVMRISADVVELLDVVDNTTIRLPLK